MGQPYQAFSIRLTGTKGDPSIHVEIDGVWKPGYIQALDVLGVSAARNAIADALADLEIAEASRRSQTPGEDPSQKPPDEKI